MMRTGRPPQGSWTEHYPDLGTGPVSFADSTSPEFFELEREAVFKRAWLNLARVEEIPRPGSYVTKEIEVVGAALILVRDRDDTIRAFRNRCRRRGHQLVGADSTGRAISGTVDALSCNRCGCGYELNGTPAQPSGAGLVGVHCELWNGFVFVNFAAEPRQSLREFLGPMITGLDGYPFEKLTERYDWVAHNNSNWKIFADAFQEYYHVPALHSQQVPAAVRDPDAGFTCGHFQLDGPHRLVSTAGRRRWLLPPEYMYPIERATRSGLVGPWQTPDIGEIPAGVNPGGIEPWGISNFQIFPNTEILIYGGWYLVYRYWPTSYNTHRFEAFTYFHPARSVRERIEHEVAAVVLKEFALQDAGMLGGTQAALEYGILDEFPLNDQEILVRHLHKVVTDWVADHAEVVR
ncbi:SRPBCC family protein [[Mycobacterium] crassicus]|uniref:SRPBCC family protein n=1 Tax=[Mycobacterium] crassicus TaxID=2872309 RepID=A0ABU5XE99_9MYCO|nr:SRPBCC family protein [Mycolicibacter sp. MYC098]MEB3019481.1 SRPBCC family protein [Mycolicibacter sp. MYC098]